MHQCQALTSSYHIDFKEHNIELATLILNSKKLTLMTMLTNSACNKRAEKNTHAPRL